MIFRVDGICNFIHKNYQELNFEKNKRLSN